MTSGEQALGKLVDVVLNAPGVGVQEITDHEYAVPRRCAWTLLSRGRGFSHLYNIHRPSRKLQPCESVINAAVTG